MLTQEGHEGDEDYTAFSYDFRNVTDLDAYTYIYQERAIQDGVPYEMVYLMSWNQMHKEISSHTFTLSSSVMGMMRSICSLLKTTPTMWSHLPPSTVHQVWKLLLDIES